MKILKILVLTMLFFSIPTTSIAMNRMGNKVLLSKLKRFKTTIRHRSFNHYYHTTKNSNFKKKKYMDWALKWGSGSLHGGEMHRVINDKNSQHIFFDETIKHEITQENFQLAMDNLARRGGQRLAQKLSNRLIELVGKKLSVVEWINEVEDAYWEILYDFDIGDMVEIALGCPVEAVVAYTIWAIPNQ